MSDETRIDEVLGEWQLARERGVAASPEELIRQHPDLAEELRRRLDVKRALDVMFAAPRVAASFPARVGPYELRSELGSGGMGTVYLAESDGERVALKLLHPHLLERPGFFRRFQQEAAAGRKVDHPNVVRTLACDLLVIDGRPWHYIVMEYVEGRTLHKLLSDLGTVPEGLLREIARQVAAGLAAVHDAGIVHRDLKPANVLITPDHRVRIMDLGVARVADASTALTREGEFAGTLDYAAPEQFRASSVGPAADLYALGVMLYELATGTNPFRAEEVPAVVRAHMEFVPEPVSATTEDVSPFFSEVVAQLLAKDPAERFDSAQTIAALLEAGERSDWWFERDSRRAKPALPRVPVRRETRLHGRAADLEILRGAWSRACEGRGNAVLLDGEAGIGKSRLVDEFLQGLDGEEVHALYGSYPPTGGMGGLSDAVISHFGRARLTEVLAPYLEVMPTLVPAFAALLSHDGAPDRAEKLRGDALQTMFCHLLQALAAERPLVWVVDDLHFASADGRAVVLSMARALEGHRVLLLLTSRPGLPESMLAHLSRLENFQRTTLRRLGAREVVELLRDAFRSEALADKLGVRVVYKSDGVPFFVFEMIRGLREGQFITELPDGTWVATKVIERIEVPSAVRDLIEARLGGLSKEEREILDVAAVQGYSFRVDLVSAVLERRRIAVLQDLAAVERRWGVIRSDEGAYRFDHHQIQEVIYEDLPGQLREEYHALLGESYEATALADTTRGADAAAICRHYLLGGRGDAAVPLLEAALDHLAEHFQNEDAVGLADLALALAGRVAGARRARVLLSKASRLDVLGRTDEALAALDEAVSLAEAQHDDALVARASYRAGWLFDRCGRWDEAQEALERALRGSRTTGDRSLEALSLTALGRVISSRGMFDRAREHHLRSIELARSIKDRRTEAAALGNLGLCEQAQGRFEEAMSIYERGIAAACESGHRRAESTQMANLAGLLVYVGRCEEAAPLLERSIASSRAIGDRGSETVAISGLGGLHWHRGRLADARACLERHLTTCREMGAARPTAIAHVNLGGVYASLGCTKRARVDVAATLEIARLHEMVDLEGLALMSAANLDEADRDLAGAERRLRESFATLRDGGVGHYSAIAGRELGRLLRVTDRRDEARTTLKAALARCEEGTEGGADVLTTCELAQVEPDVVEVARALLAERSSALSRLDRMRALFLLWYPTRASELLEQAHTTLMFVRDHAPEEYRESMIENVPLHRDIMAAWREHGGSESETVVST